MPDPEAALQYKQKERARQILVIAPHADDEVIGCGGMVAGLAASGAAVDIVVMSAGGVLHRHRANAISIEERNKELAASATVLGVRQVSILFPGKEMRMDTLAQLEIVTALDALLDAVAYDEVFVPPSDQNADHRACHAAALSALRLGARPAPSLIAIYETAPESSWGAPALSPTMFVDISAHWETKLQALACYASQARLAPHPRSPETLTKMAAFRGAQCGARFAEAFHVLRIVR